MAASQRDPSPPTSRDDFKIAIMCALPLEADAVIALFDKCWDSKQYHRAPGDTNTYTTGAIGRHNIVLVHLPGMGKVAAATSATYLRASFTGVRLSLVVGICGGVPSGRSLKDEEVLLGDVVVSDGIIQYDFGRQFSHGFIRKGHVQDSLPRPSPPIRAFLAMLQAKQTQKHLQENTIRYFNDLQQTLDNMATYPGITEDRLFKPTYRHKHRDGLKCSVCDSLDGVCDEALTLSCQELGCDEHELVARQRPASLFGVPIIHFGLFASSDSVMKSGEARDEAASRDGIIAFEMEGAGIWETFPGCLIIKSVCDYADSHKSKRWQTYAAATAAATTMAILECWSAETADALSPLSRRDLILREPDTPPMDPARRVAILKALHTSPYRDRKERNPDRVLGTCEWFVTDNRFSHWREGQSSCMLLVSADPGCGKSVLAKYLIDSELPTTESRTTCYFFFKDDFDDQRSARSALCCILHQLFEQKKILLSNKMIERFEAGGEKITDSFVELWDILVTAAQDKNAGEIVCILDAFDECDDHGQSDFTRCLRKLYRESNNFNLKFLLTSRPYGHIRRDFQPLDIPSLPVIRLSGEMETEMSKISKEIEIYIRSRVRGIRESLKLDPSEENVLLEEFLRIPHRTYIWAHLTLDVVENDIYINKTRIYEVTSQLPRTAHEAYERILSRSPNIEEAKKLLHIVIAAVRPLSTREMNIALAIRETSRSNQDLDLKPDERFREHVMDLCGLFVTIVDSKIYLLHQTAKEFLVQDGPKDRTKNTNNQLKWKSSLREQESHRVISQICIWHLLFVNFEKDTLKLGSHFDSDQYFRYYSFLKYCANNWVVHFRMSGMNNKTTAYSLLKICLCDPESKHHPPWFEIFWRSTYRTSPLQFTTLMIASYFGLDQLVQVLLKGSRADINLVDGDYQRSALSWASEYGYDNVVKLLLERDEIYKYFAKISTLKRLDIDAKDIYGRTPLLYAARMGHIAIAKRLVMRGARVDSVDYIGGTPGSYAMCHEQKSLVNVLLRTGHQFESMHSSLIRLLFSATISGDRAAIKLLLESGKVDVNAKDDGGQTPLIHAIQQRDAPTASLLLEIGKADVNIKDNTGGTALLRAVEKGDEFIVVLLLESGKADINIKDDFGRAPLLWAVERGNKLLVRLLLKSGKADVDIKDKFGQAPLLQAVKQANEPMVRLLIKSGKADINIQDNDGRTPLLHVVFTEDISLIHLLLENDNIDANLSDIDGRTPLSDAVHYLRRRAFKELVESGKVDIGPEYAKYQRRWC